MSAKVIKEKKTKKRSLLKILLAAVLAIVLFCVIAALIGLQRSGSKGSGGYAPSDEVRTVTDDGSIGTVEISILALEEGLNLRRATYTYSGRVLYTVREDSETVFYTCDDDGSNIRRLCRGSNDTGKRLLPFADNRRVLLGDYVLECPEGETLDDCAEDSAVLIPVHFPEEFSKDSNVTDVWTEVIIAPDCGHFAWTIRRKDCGAVNAMGRLVRTDDAYEITDAEYISNMNTFSENADGELVYTPVIGGEVKQFVHGGNAISLVGSSDCGMGDSVIQDVAAGEVILVTKTPGYDETTILSPDERLGLTMTSRFSESTDLAVMGLLPRPYGQALHNIMGQVYMYCVTGVRGGREGNIGPALIDLERSMTEKGYKGIDLSDPEEKWAFSSPLSWNDTGSKAMWMEEEKGGNRIRVMIAELKDYQPGEKVEAVETPAVGDYAAAPEKNMDYSGKVPGKVSGSAELTKKTGFMGVTTVTISYDNYSDDGILWYNGTESSSGSIITKTNYKADIQVTDEAGQKAGELKADMYFSAAYKLTSFFSGSTTPELDTAKSSGSSEWEGLKADISSLVK